MKGTTMIKKIFLCLIASVFLLAAQPAVAGHSTGLKQVMKHLKEQYHQKKQHGRH